MDYFVKKHINKNLIVKVISESLSFVFLLSYFFYLGGGYSPAPIIWVLIIFSFSISFIINFRYFKKEDYHSFTLPLYITILFFFIEIMSILFTDFYIGYAVIVIFSGFISLILISIGISVNIQMILLKPGKQNLIIQKAKEDEKIKQHAMGTSFTADSKKRLFGMIKLKKTLDLKETSEKLGLPQAEIENLLFDLAGENKISGDFKEGIFHITSDIDEFVNQLDDMFSEWSGNEKTKHMKI